MAGVDKRWRRTVCYRETLTCSTGESPVHSHDLGEGNGRGHSAVGARLSGQETHL